MRKDRLELRTGWTGASSFQEAGWLLSGDLRDEDNLKRAKISWSLKMWRI